MVFANPIINLGEEHGDIQSLKPLRRAGGTLAKYDVREFPQNNNAKMSSSFVNHALSCPLLWTLR